MADKGNTFVIINIHDYNYKIKESYDANNMLELHRYSTRNHKQKLIKPVSNQKINSAAAKLCGPLQPLVNLT